MLLKEHHYLAIKASEMKSIIIKIVEESIHLSILKIENGSITIKYQHGVSMARFKLTIKQEENASTIRPKLLLFPLIIWSVLLLTVFESIIFALSFLLNKQLLVSYIAVAIIVLILLSIESYQIVEELYNIITKIPSITVENVENIETAKE